MGPLGTKILSVIERCPQLRGFRYISGRHGMHNQAVEHNVAAFQSFPLLYAGREGYAEASTTNNSANLMSSC